MQQGEKPYKDIFKVSYPAFCELVLLTFTNMINMMMIGRLSSMSISAVGYSTLPYSLLISILSAVNTGTTTLVSWKTGAKDQKGAKDILGEAIILNFFLGIILAFLGVTLAPAVVTFMGAARENFSDAKIYFQVISSSIVFQSITMAITAALRGAGETFIPFVYNIIRGVLNVIFNFFLIYGHFNFPALGVLGAGISSLAATFVAFLISLYVVFLSNKTVLKISRQNFKVTKEDVRKILKIGIPSALEQIVMQGGNMLYYKMVASLGAYIYAAHQIGMSIGSLSVSTSTAFGIAGTALVGKSLGKHDFEGAKKYAKSTILFSNIVSVFVAVFFIVFSYPLALLYTDNTYVAKNAQLTLILLALSQPGQSTQLSLSGILRGAGDSAYPLYATFFGIWVFRVAVAYLFIFKSGFGLAGAWVALLLDQYLRAAIVHLRFRFGPWMKKYN
ncbi:MAG: MATE family efflux transporter [Clostridiaceae bacterium]|nr:MATE family efflux transporter [Clostridiaceae bacterium]